jgi:hypothetical protein
MIRFKRLISIIAASLTLTLSSCTPNSGFTLIFAGERNGQDVTVEINKDACEIIVETPDYKSTNYCLKVVEYDEYQGFGEGPVFVYYFFYEPYFSQSQYLLIFYLPNNQQAFPDSRLKTTNWFFTF